jgi:uncharacterized protein YcfL
MNSRLACGGLIAAALLLAGCATAPVTQAPLDSAKYTVENTEKFVVLDSATDAAVSCTGLQERTLADGRLDVVADVKNREDSQVQVQIQCVFKSDQGFSVGDETPWQSVTLAQFSTETVHFTAFNPDATRYTIRVRQARNGVTKN